MKRKRTIFTLCCIMLYSTVNSQVPANDPHWGSAEWYDDFRFMYKTYNSGDNQWYVGDWVVTHNWDHGGEPQNYQSDNVVKIYGDPLLIEAKEEFTSNCSACTTPDHDYTSGQITAGYPGYSNRTIQYGYLEAKIKISDEYGLWPAFWAWNNPGNDEEEIDIFEMIPGSYHGGQLHTKNIMTTNTHNNQGSSNPLAGIKISSINDYTNWHTYAIDWTPNKIIWYVDGEVIRILINPNQANGGFHNETSIILNLALNPWVAYPDTYTYPDTNYYSATNFLNASMEVEYISYYKLDMSECHIPVYYNSTLGLNSYNNKVKKSITIGNVTAPFSSNSNSPTILRATEHITLDKGFEIPIGEELYIDVNSCN
ncbi:MAG: glycoside hydrolase family 16 protein [Flavobacteriales bacterium]|nr:glycoside hydrolase family 16 protein [Flavobacteriales bacterium]